MTCFNWLPELVLFETFNGDWKAYEAALYEFYTQDFIATKPNFRGAVLAVKRHPQVNGKDATFWHITGEGDTHDDKLPNLRRCERIRWPKPVIENCDGRHLKIWENKHSGEISVCIWSEEAEYLVILRKRRGYILFWTAYPVTQTHSKAKLEREYAAYKMADAAPKSGTVTPST